MKPKSMYSVSLAIQQTDGSKDYIFGFIHFGVKHSGIGFFRLEQNGLCSNVQLYRH